MIDSRPSTSLGMDVDSSVALALQAYARVWGSGERVCSLEGWNWNVAFTGLSESKIFVLCFQQV